MRERRLPRATYANVMSTIAVVIALGGTSYAAVTLPDNSVTSQTIKNGAVHTSDLAKGSVTSRKLKGGAVTTSKLAAGSVTGTNLAPGSVTESDVVPGSLNGAAFQCAPGDEGLDNRHMCFFKIATGGVTWAEAVAMCRAHGATPATLASPSEIQAAAALGGSPFTTGTFWTSQINTGGAFSAATAWAVEVANGSIVYFLSEPVTTTTIPSVACVYHAADES